MPRAKRIEPLPEEEETVAVDETQEQDNLSGEIGEADEDPFLVHLAKSLGYKEAEEWKKDHGPERDRDPASRQGVRDFLAKTPEVFASLKESSERAARAAAEAIEDERRRIREEATRVIETSDDPQERRQAAERIAQSAGDPPEVADWKARNPWFNTDPDAQALALVNAQRIANQRGSVSLQLQEAEAAVRRVFPQYFASGGEQRLSDVRRSAPNPPQVQQGNRATAAQPREKGFAQIPRADREAFQNHLLRAYMGRGLTQAQAEAKYAHAYWLDTPVDPSERGPELYPLKPQSNVWASRRGRTQ